MSKDINLNSKSVGMLDERSTLGALQIPSEFTKGVSQSKTLPIYSLQMPPDPRSDSSTLRIVHTQSYVCTLGHFTQGRLNLLMQNSKKGPLCVEGTVLRVQVLSSQYFRKMRGDPMGMALMGQTVEMFLPNEEIKTKGCSLKLGSKMR